MLAKVLSANQTVTKLAVPGYNKPELLTRAQFDGKLQTSLNWTGWKQVAQWIDPSILIRQLYFQFVNTTLSTSRFPQRLICHSMIYSFKFGYLMILCNFFNSQYSCFWRKSIILLFAQRSARYPEWKSCKIYPSWPFVDHHFKNAAGSMLLLFLPVKAANNSQMDVCKQSKHKFPNMQR